MPLRSAPGWTSTALVMLVPVYALVLNRLNADGYYLSVQEDGYVEWCTFWAFFAAFWVYLMQAKRALRPLQKSWFVLGLAGFCLFVAMEEISWGQRIFGFQPPAYFLANNYQQEFNVHNVADGTLRQWGLYAVLLGFGVLLPLAACVPQLDRGLARLGIAAPPLFFLPLFASAALINWRQPLPFAAEWVELMAGCNFLLLALHTQQAGSGRGAKASGEASGQTWRLLSCFVLLACVGAISARLVLVRDPEAGNRLASAKAELLALAQDFRKGRILSRCGLDSRLYNFVEHTAQPTLRRGAFAARSPQQTPPARAEFFLDPWHTSYWVRDNCSVEQGKRIVFVYSFGPNRRRDSPMLQVGGDDLAVFVEQPYP